MAAIKTCEAGSRLGAVSSGGTVSACGQPWILKRTDLSNGQGATIVPRPSAAWAAGPEVVNLTAHGHRWIAQRYIADPLLLDGRKSELRVYWLVASLKPLVVLYNTGTVRLNAAKYTRSDYGNDLEPAAMENWPRQVLRLEMEPVAPNDFCVEFSGSSTLACGGLWAGVLPHPRLPRGSSADFRGSS